MLILKAAKLTLLHRMSSKFLWSHDESINVIKKLEFESKTILKSKNLVDKFKVIVSQTTSEHAGEPSKDGKYKLLATVKVLKPN